MVKRICSLREVREVDISKRCSQVETYKWDGTQGALLIFGFKFSPQFLHDRTLWSGVSVKNLTEVSQASYS